VRLIRVSAAGAARARRLEELLAGRHRDEPELRRPVEDAQVQGSLELAGLEVDLDAVAAARDPGATGPAADLHRARARVPPDAPFDVASLLAWHGELAPDGGRYRAAPRDREEGPPASPVEFIPTRLEALAHWSTVESSRELSPAQLGALVLARFVEILPFDEANGRVSRLACSHVVVRAGGRPPILRGEDAERLRAALGGAFRLDTEPLVSLLEEASERADAVLLGALGG